VIQVIKKISQQEKTLKNNLKLKNIYDGTYEVGEVSLELNVIVELSM
jgi:hypothetical protein